MDIRQIPLDDLVLDPNLNLRDRLDDFTVERYADAWERLPPITVYEVDGRLLIADGFHRHAAAVMLGKRSIPAEIRVGSFTDALDFVAGVNLYHGLPLTRAERRRAVEVKLKLHHDWSDRRMSEELAVSRELVAKIRRQLIEGHQIPNEPGRYGSDGKFYTSAGLPREKEPGERLPREKPGIHDHDEGESTQRGRKGMGGAAGLADTGAEFGAAGKPAARGGPGEEAPAPWESGASGKDWAQTPPVEVSAPTIDEMLEVMAKQIAQVVAWTNAEGFVEAYHSASANARGLFHASVIKLAARADQLRRS